jgi:hypothetical protein
MPRFGRRRDESGPAVPVAESRFASVAAIQGLEPVEGTVFDSHLAEAIHESARVLYGATARYLVGREYRYDTRFHDVFRTTIDDRAVTVANGWTNINPGLVDSASDVKGAVCVVELPSILSLACVQVGASMMLYTRVPMPAGRPNLGTPGELGAAPADALRSRRRLSAGRGDTPTVPPRHGRVHRYTSRCNAPPGRSGF